MGYSRDFVRRYLLLVPRGPKTPIPKMTLQQEARRTWTVSENIRHDILADSLQPVSPKTPQETHKKQKEKDKKKKEAA